MEEKHTALAETPLDESPLAKAFRLAGGPAKLAKKIGIKPPSVCGWRVTGRVPAERCISVEEALDRAVTRYELRPDVFGDGPKSEAA